MKGWSVSKHTLYRRPGYSSIGIAIRVIMADNLGIIASGDPFPPSPPVVFTLYGRLDPAVRFSLPGRC